MNTFLYLDNLIANAKAYVRSIFNCSYDVFVWNVDKKMPLLLDTSEVNFCFLVISMYISLLKHMIGDSFPYIISNFYYVACYMIFFQNKVKLSVS